MIGKIPPVHWPNVQKVLPAVYGDELSYYELLAKMEKLVNDLIEQANAVGVEVNEFEEALKNIENIDDIDAQVQALQETADTIQETLDALPSYEEFTELSQQVTKNTGNKIPFPIPPNSKYGTDGQVLRTNGDGSTQWQNPIIPTDTQAATYIAAWLNEHPDATTTVQDNSINALKLQDGSVEPSKLSNDTISLIEYSKGILFNLDNLVMTSNLIVHNKYYVNGAFSESELYTVVKIYVEAGTTYVVLPSARFISKETGTPIYTNSTPLLHFTPDASEYLYISFFNDIEAHHGGWGVYTLDDFEEKSSLGTYQNPEPTRWVSDAASNITVKPSMIEGFEYGNLKYYLSRTNRDRYATASGVGVTPTYGNNTSYDVYKLEAISTIYTFTPVVRYLIPMGANDLTLSASIQRPTTFDNTNLEASYLLLTIDKSNLDSQEIVSNENPTGENTYPDWLEELKTSPKPTITAFESYKGSVTDAIKLNTVVSSISSHVEFAFSGAINSFTEGWIISFALYNGNESIKTFGVDISENDIVLTDYNYGNPITETLQHGLTIQNDVQIHITQNLTNIFKFALTSNGTRYEHTFIVHKSLNTFPMISVNQITMEDCSFSWGSKDVNNEIWCFGDSYFTANTDNRWPYYLNEDAYYDGLLFSNSSGGTSQLEYNSLVALATMYKPKRIFWALGMNDGSDTVDAPSSSWLNIFNTLKQYCLVNGIELIAATIPTVPRINNEMKNYTIRNSGLKYVDFAKAVGADSQGNWYAGMLSSDNVHPTEKGAKALYNRLIADFIEITMH